MGDEIGEEGADHLETLLHSEDDCADEYEDDKVTEKQEIIKAKSSKLDATTSEERDEVIILPPIEASPIKDKVSIASNLYKNFL